jgi:soluble cytochrome b562
MQNVTDFFTSVSAFFNTPTGFAILWTAIVGFIIYLASKYNPFVEVWKKYEGSIIAGIRFAEKSIDDSSENKSLAKLDAALKYVIKAYESANKGKSPSETLINAFKEGIQIKHDQMERVGTLPKATKTKVFGLILLCSVTFAVAGCGVPVGKDISSGIGGGNSIKLDNSNNNVIVLTDGELKPENVVEKAGDIIVPDVPLPQVNEDNATGDAESNDDAVEGG